MFWACNFHVLNWQFNEQSFVILWFSWCKKKCLWKRFTCSWWQNMLFWQRTTCTVERNLEYVYDIDQLYNQSRLDPDETILQVVLKGSFLTSELTNLARHYLEISAVLKDDKGTIMLSLNQRFFRWINRNGRYPNENFLFSVAYLGTYNTLTSYKMIDGPDFGHSLRLFMYTEILWERWKLFSLPLKTKYWT